MTTIPADRLNRLVARWQTVQGALAAGADQESYVRLSREFAELDPIVATITALRKAEKERDDLNQMINDPAADPDMAALAEAELGTLDPKIEELERQLKVQLLPKDAADEKSAILELRAGTGGEEAALFAGDLFRMYQRYADRMGWKVNILSASESATGGYKEIIANITGKGVFARLKFESGVHRVQRVPATEAQGRIHTSACTVAVLPEADAVDDVVLNPAELRIDTFRASGAGGQHVNKTDSAIRITHLPTNIVVQCQNDRSQHRNRAEAMAMLKSKLYELELRKRQEEKQVLEDTKTDIGWGHQIRSYVLDQSRIKDLRTNIEIGNTQAVLDGNLDDFIEASLKQGVR